MFIKELKFLDNSVHFKKNSKILFNNSQNELIDFYIETTLKIKENDKIGKLSNRLQINCILGGNGTGKSSLLDHIYHFLCRPQEGIPYGYDYFIEMLLGDEKIIFSNQGYFNYQYNAEFEKIIPIIKYNNLSVIYDDFFIGSKNLVYSINNKLTKSFINGDGLNIFYCDIFNFLLRNTTNKEIFSNFLNIPISYSCVLYWEHYFNEEYYDYIDQEALFTFFDFLNSYSSQNNNQYKNLYNFFGKEQIQLFYLRFTTHLINELLLLDTDIQQKVSEKNYNIYLDAFINYLNILEEITINEEELNTIFLPKNLAKYNSLPTIKSKINKAKEIVIKYKNQQSYKENFTLQDLNIPKDILTLITHYSKFLNGLQKLFYVGNPQDTKSILQGSFNSNNSFSELEKKILGLKFFILDIKFELPNKEDSKSFNHLSSGEKIMLIRFVNIYKKIQEEIQSSKQHFIILIDEPDLHLHLEWQKEYIQRLIDVFSTLKDEGITMHFIIATHSPFIVSDLPKENIIKLEKNGNFTKQVKLKDQEETFGANYIDIIRNGFFKDGILMGSFSADIISNLALIEKLKLVKEYIDVGKLSPHEKEIFNKYVNNNIPTNELKKQIGDDFLRDNLLYFKIEENETN